MGGIIVALVMIVSVITVAGYAAFARFLEHRERTGEILGVGTDELEGYDWPVDGRHYGPGDKPKVGPEILQHPDLTYDPKRRDPAPGVRPTTWVGDL